MAAQAFCGEDVLAPKHSELETVWLFGGEAQLVESPARTKVFRWSGVQTSGHYVQGAINRLVNEASVSATTPNRCAVLSNRVDQGKGSCARYCGTRIPTSSR